jgi:hypothetical protein
VNWSFLSQNVNAIPILEKHLNKIYWPYLSANPSAIHILEKNMDKVDWSYLSGNPAAIHLLEQNLDKVDWSYLSRNPAAIHLLEQHQDRIDWFNFFLHNRGIVTYNYPDIKDHSNEFKEELMQVVFHPRNYDKFAAWGYEEFQ